MEVVGFLFFTPLHMLGQEVFKSPFSELFPTFKVETFQRMITIDEKRITLETEVDDSIQPKITKPYLLSHLK